MDGDYHDRMRAYVTSYATLHREHAEREIASSQQLQAAADLIGQVWSGAHAAIVARRCAKMGQVTKGYTCVHRRSSSGYCLTRRFSVTNRGWTSLHMAPTQYVWRSVLSHLTLWHRIYRGPRSQEAELDADALQTEALQKELQRSVLAWLEMWLSCTF